MPEWLIFALTLLYVVASVLSAWTWTQALYTHRAVEGNEEQREYTRTVLRRMTGVLVATVLLSLVGGLSLTPVSDVIRGFRSLLLVGVTLAIVGLGLHEYWVMLDDLSDDESD